MEICLRDLHAVLRLYCSFPSWCVSMNVPEPTCWQPPPFLETENGPVSALASLILLEAI